MKKLIFSLLFSLYVFQAYSYVYNVNFTAFGVSNSIDSITVNNTIIPNGHTLRLTNTIQATEVGVFQLLYNKEDFYTKGRLLFKAYSGKYISIFSEKINADTTINIEFVECKDGDNNYYPVVKIGSQFWMAENLKTTKYNDGSNITYISDDYDWNYNTYNESVPAFCWYNNDIPTNRNSYGAIYPVVDSYKKAYGGLYNWFAIDTQKLNPIGWHICTSDEWKVMTNYISDDQTAGLYLKSQNGWFNDYGNTYGAGIDIFGFNALPGGYRSGGFSAVSNDAIFMMSDKYTLAQVWACDISYGSSLANVQPALHVTNGASIRCVRNLNNNTVTNTNSLVNNSVLGYINSNGKLVFRVC